MPGRFTLIGPGRAGSAISAALVDRGWSEVRTYRRGDDLATAATGADLCVIATPDDVIAHVAQQIEPGEATLLHLSGATPLDALGRHRAAGLHPLVSLADPTLAAQALRTAWFGIAGEPVAQQIADQLSGRWFELSDTNRVLYHTAAVVGSNHIVALLGQVARIADEIDVPFEAFMALVASSVENTRLLGPVDALTGPASRGDEATIDRHRSELQLRLPDELAAYDSVLELARRLVDQRRAQAD